MGIAEFTENQLRLETEISATTFNKAYTGANIYMLTANKIALALCVEVESILN